MFPPRKPDLFNSFQPATNPTNKKQENSSRIKALLHPALQTSIAFFPKKIIPADKSRNKLHNDKKNEATVTL